MPNDDPLTVVGTYRSSYDAEFARSLLRSAGIETFVSNDLPGARLGYIMVSVRQDDEPEAAQILRGLPSSGSASKDGMSDAVRVGFVGGAIIGGFVGAIAGWLWFGAGVGAAIGIAAAALRWRSRRASGDTEFGDRLRNPEIERR